MVARRLSAGLERIRQVTWSVDRPLDVTEPAHLGDARGFRPVVRRYAAPAELADVVRRFWVPVWSLAPGEVSTQHVLQYPVCQLVVGHDGARVVGPASGLGRQELTGSGWVVGAMMQPAAGVALVGDPMTALVDAARDLHDLPLPETRALADRVTAIMTPDPLDVARQQQACAAVGEALAVLLPVDEEGLLVNAIVEFVEGDGQVRRVGQVCEKFDLPERTLQRLTARRVGLSPKWLIQRRRLHDAAARLQSGEATDLARAAADLGYADQAHFTRDFRSVTGLTPGAFVAQRRS